MLKLKVAQIFPKFAKMWPDEFYQKREVFKIPQKVTKYLGYFVWKIIAKNSLKWPNLVTLSLLCILE